MGVQGPSLCAMISIHAPAQALSRALCADTVEHTYMCVNGCVAADLHLDEEQLSRVVNSEFWEEHSRAGFQVSDSATITASRASRPRRRSAPPGHPPRRNSLQQGSEFSYGALWEGPTSCGEAESTEHANANECDSGGDPPAPATSGFAPSPRP